MAWKDEVDITKYHIAAAPYGGPIGRLSFRYAMFKTSFALYRIRMLTITN